MSFCCFILPFLWGFDAEGIPSFVAQLPSMLEISYLCEQTLGSTEKSFPSKPSPFLSISILAPSSSPLLARMSIYGFAVLFFMYPP
ncbi:hypothetical protein C8J56DRAFT_968531 [Mycena floridula]|nr:hypothetical protein C8J56DRAFT_968531 [Mycena floridula]